MPQVQPTPHRNLGGRSRKRYRIRIRGKQRKVIDADMFLDALLLMAEDLEREKSGLPPVDDGSVRNPTSSSRP